MELSPNTLLSHRKKVPILPQVEQRKRKVNKHKYQLSNSHYQVFLYKKRPAAEAASAENAPTDSAASVPSSGYSGGEPAQAQAVAVQTVEQQQTALESESTAIDTSNGNNEINEGSSSSSTDQQSGADQPKEQQMVEQIQSKQRQRMHASKALTPAPGTWGSMCNSAELRQMMDSQMVPGNANASKRRIYELLNRKQFTEGVGGAQRLLDVICANSMFSYRIATDLFCEHTKANVTCFVYQQQP
ncbi:hypothetical protein niasHS_014205 [Heterodera schachtii]|uniref:Ground-like domain-containing protein n=1 Tax=Heterodera schachtii TaxID=97005 RepID=A0ABD2IC09_HETSC